MSLYIAKSKGKVYLYLHSLFLYSLSYWIWLFSRNSFIAFSPLLSLQYLHPPFPNNVPAFFSDILPHLVCRHFIFSLSPLYSDSKINSSPYFSLISFSNISCVFLLLSPYSKNAHALHLCPSSICCPLA